MTEYYMKKVLEKQGYKIISETNEIIKSNGEVLSTVSEFTNWYNRKNGESFECIYNEHATGFTILQCTECNSLIIYNEFELCENDTSALLKIICPTCTNKEYAGYTVINPNNCTKEEKKEYDACIALSAYQEECDARKKRRKGLYDWQISGKKYYGKKYFLQLELECENVTRSYIKGLKLKIHLSKKEKDDDIGYTQIKSLNIPLSFSAFYIQCIYQHLGKCPESMRSKYYIGKAKEKKEV